MNGWFFGFKFHMIINHDMDIVSMKITGGSTNDLAALDDKMVKDLMGVLFGDKGYIGKKKQSNYQNVVSIFWPSLEKTWKIFTSVEG